jgi:Kef-type K+ transport system membrane component KefB
MQTFRPHSNGTEKKSLLLPFILIGCPLLAAGFLIAGMTPNSVPSTAVHLKRAASGVATLMPNIILLLAQIAAIVLCCRVIGSLFRWFGQPQVIGETAAGIVLGPTVLGNIAPGLSAALFPFQTLGFLHSVSQIGLVIFMFLVGLELDLNVLVRRKHMTVLVSLASIALPFSLGVLLAYWLYPRFGVSGVGFTEFALFIGTSMSVTAFPVLAHLLKETRLVHTELGALALSCAALSDIVVWIILAGVVILANASRLGTSLLVTIGGVVAYLIVMIKIVRPVLAKLFGRDKQNGHKDKQDDRVLQNRLAIVLILVLCSSSVTEWLGVHALFGAFVMGAIMPRDNGITGKLIVRLEDFTIVMLLPLFFVFTGLRTDMSSLGNATVLCATVLIFAVAIVGKIGAATLAAHASGAEWREAGALGILMNARGLMELVVLNIALDIGVISNMIFSMLVLMAVGTTLMTLPALRLVMRSRIA